jgi:hypothetical protein
MAGIKKKYPRKNYEGIFTLDYFREVAKKMG